MKITYRSMSSAAIALLWSVFSAGCSNPAAVRNQPGPLTGGKKSSAAKLALTLSEPAEPAVAIPSTPAKKPYRIAVSLLTRDDDFYQSLEKGLKDEAAREKVPITIESGDKDLNKQINEVQNFVAQKYDAIILCPVDSQGVLSAVTAANNASIPVFTADIASNGGKIVCHVASDNVQGGYLVGEYSAKTLLHGKGKVAILDLSTVTSVQDRVRGFKQALSRYPGIHIVADQDVPGAKRENALPVATNIMTAHPDIALIFGINDPVALGALSALQQLDNRTVQVVGFDAGPEAQSYIASGSQLKAEAIQYPRLIGKTTLDVVVKSLNGQSVPSKIAIPTGLVTQSSFKK